MSGQKVSTEYLQEMAYWYAGLALNITPHVADYQKNQFLKYAAPSEYGRLQAEFGARADFIRKNNASTQFSTQAMTVEMCIRDSSTHPRIDVANLLFDPLTGISIGLGMRQK